MTLSYDAIIRPHTKCSLPLPNQTRGTFEKRLARIYTNLQHYEANKRARMHYIFNRSRYIFWSSISSHLSRVKFFISGIICSLFGSGLNKQRSIIAMKKRVRFRCNEPTAKIGGNASLLNLSEKFLFFLRCYSHHVKVARESWEEPNQTQSAL